MVEFTPRQQDAELAARVLAFVRETIVPYEKDSRLLAHGPENSLIAELRAHARRAGLLTPHLSHKWGGQGLDNRGMAQVFKAAGHSVLGPLALNIQAPDEGNMHLLDQVATAEQKEKFLKPLAAGDIRSAFLMTEPDGGAGSDPGMMNTRAELVGGEWVINGRKTFATGFDGAGFSIVMAKSDGGATMFLVPADTPGFKIERVMDTLDHSMPGGHAVVTLTDVRVPPKWVLGAPDEGFRYAQVRLAPARLTHCMRWLGLAKRSHEIAIAYACRREAFGKPIIDHEGVGFMLADNELDLRQAELMIDWCAWTLDQGQKGTVESSMAKVSVSEALFRVADRCVQILGGMGITQDTIVEQAFREIRAFRIYDGPSEVHRWSIAKRLKHAHAKTLNG